MTLSRAVNRALFFLIPAAAALGITAPARCLGNDPFDVFRKAWDGAFRDQARIAPFSTYGSLTLAAIGLSSRSRLDCGISVWKAR